MKENGQTFTILIFSLAPTLGSQGRGIARGLTKGAFRWGSPPKFKKESRHLCPRRQGGQANVWSKPVAAFLRLVYIYSLVVSQESCLSEFQVWLG